MNSSIIRTGRPSGTTMVYISPIATTSKITCQKW
jgi:hypothetical protein